MKAEWTNKDVLTQSETTGQSKSILVIDTPNNCEECNIIYLQRCGESTCDSSDWSRRPSWCPLRPLPPRKNNNESEMVGCLQMDIGYTLGWNSCLDEIVGDNNDEV